MLLLCTVILLVTVFVLFRANNLKAYVHLTPSQMRQIAARIPVELNPRAKFNCLVSSTDSDCKLFIGQYLSYVLGYHYRPTQEIMIKLEDSLKGYDRSKVLSTVESGAFPNNFEFTLNDRQRAIKTILAEPALSQHPDLLKELNEALPTDEFISRAIVMPLVAEKVDFWKMFFGNFKLDYALKDIIAITGAVDRIMQWCSGGDNEVTKFMNTPHKASLFVACKGDVVAAVQFAKARRYGNTTQVDEYINLYLTELYAIPRWIGREDQYNTYVKNILLDANAGYLSSGSRSHGLDRYLQLKAASARAEAAVLVLQQITPADREPLIAKARQINARLRVSEDSFDTGKEFTRPIRNWEPLFSIFWISIETEETRTFLKSFLASTTVRQMKNTVKTYLEASDRSLPDEL